MNEVWKSFEGYGKGYEVSNLGRVRRGNKVLTNHIDRYGYVYVSLSYKGSIKKFKVHRLVAESFIENPNKLPCVNHINQIKSDNSINNLEWCTVADNTRMAKGIKVVVFWEDRLQTFDSALQASNELGLTLDTIYKLSKQTTYLLGVLQFILTEGKSLPKVSLGNTLDRGIIPKGDKFIVRVTHSGKRNYVGTYETKAQALLAKQEYINKYCPITSEYLTEEPDLTSVYKLINMFCNVR